LETNRGAPTPPIAFGGSSAVTPRLDTPTPTVDDGLIERLRGACADVSTEPRVLDETSRDWWPLAMIWALDDQVAARAGVVVRPTSVDEVAAVLRVCNEAKGPVTAAAGRSGVGGASVPLHGGVVLDCCGLTGIVDVDSDSMIVDVRAGTFGDVFEDELRDDHGVTVGHWPQSVELSTVGGWLACRGAGQYSTRYGKIEDIVVGVDVVLADGRVLSTGGAPRQAVGPDLTQLFVGSEGTLGVITGARLRCHPIPPVERRLAYGFPSFAAGLDACRRILHRGATPAVLRLYDDIEGQRNFETGEGTHPLLVLDEGDSTIVEATMQVDAEECAGDSTGLDGEALLTRWLEHRNDVSALEALISRGYVVDTMEIAARWHELPSIYDAATTAIRGVEHTLVVSAHQSHSYADGACLYFTFGGQPPADDRDSYYRAAWDAGTRAVLKRGGALSHHHGVGLNRARFVRDALGDGLDVLAAVKSALDPCDILNPGKLGLPSSFGPSPAWP
jgi:alkyldihydroxyacetonephosphate synthase